ncbi:MAG: hypothetical protein HYY50_05300 [Candidatus Kerfeldbacteria bacterium]|nr:hypothetical protein [Candidatus Kerfeldbacteria bacterium]
MSRTAWIIISILAVLVFSAVLTYMWLYPARVETNVTNGPLVNRSTNTNQPTTTLDTNDYLDEALQDLDAVE